MGSIIANAILETAVTAMMADAAPPPASFTAQKPTVATNTKSTAITSTIQQAKPTSSVVYYRDTQDYAKQYAELQKAINQPGANYMLRDMMLELQAMGNIPINQVQAYSSSQYDTKIAESNRKSATLDKTANFYQGLDTSSRMHQSAIDGLKKSNNAKAESYTVGGIFSRDVDWNLEKAENAARFGRIDEAKEWYDTAVYADKLNKITR